MYKLNQVEILERPGYFGNKRALREKELTEKYGETWKECWQVKDMILSFEDATMYYEDAYCIYLSKNIEIIPFILNFAECYDSERKNILDHTTYNSTQIPRHIQDIAIRRILLRSGAYFKKFRGVEYWDEYEEEDLLHVRGASSKTNKVPNGAALMPGNIPFHVPDLILEQNNIPKWAKIDSVEAFWQANKVIIKVKDV